MRWTVLTALTAASVVALASWPADAQTRKRARSLERQGVVRVAPRIVRTRASTQITVRKARSFLDPGTEVLPMSRSYTDYAIPPNHYPTRIWDTTNHYRWPLPTEYELPGHYR
jgi:histidinol-phosphate/aromatic aminotransferase/cobyric acid decarboxylase-like protein